MSAVPGKTLPVVHVSFTFSRGGAGIAAGKMLTALNRYGIPAFGVSGEFSSIEGAIIYGPNKLSFAQHFLARLVEHLIIRVFLYRPGVKRSSNFFTAPNVKRLIEGVGFQSGVLHIQWVNNSTLSISDFNKLPSGTIISLHDEWLYLGVDHYLFDKGSSKLSGNNLTIIGKKLDEFVRAKKKRILDKRRDIIYTAPSKWLLQQASTSGLLRGKDVRLLPNIIDTDVFLRGGDKDVEAYRNEFQIPADAITIGFGAIDCDKNPLKGAALLRQALAKANRQLSEDVKNRLIILLFGNGSFGVKRYMGIKAVGLGHISNKAQMSKVYQACDFLVVPSLVESFGQIAAESLSCETPVVCFSVGGLVDVVVDRVNGFTAKPESVEDLKERILEMIKIGKNKRRAMGRVGRRCVVENFSEAAVVRIYKEILEDACNMKNNV